MSQSAEPFQYPFERCDAYAVALALYARVGTLACPAEERNRLDRAVKRIVTSLAEAVAVEGQPALPGPCEAARVSCVRAVALLGGMRALGFITRGEDFEARTYLVALFGFLGDLRDGVLPHAGNQGVMPS